MPRDPLADYAAKRAFDATPEPACAKRRMASEGPLLFVVQQHAASRMHYDLRLECDGVLRSWAVPRGLSADRREKRLAMETEDHPFAYASFEGVIPKGQYGAGRMIVWDFGVYAPDEPRLLLHDRAAAEAAVRAGLAKGKLSFQLRGEKVRGSFALVRTAKDPKAWLVIKHQDRFVGEADLTLRDRSPLCGETVETVQGVPGRVPVEKLVPSGRLAALPRALAPMLAESTGAAFVRDGWTWEPKLDGYRAIAIFDGKTVQLRSRKGLALAGTFPLLAAEVAGQGVPLVLDGEIVAFDAGRPSFGVLQERAALRSARDIEAADRKTPLAFFAFDLLHFAGIDLRARPYHERRRYLVRCVLPSARLQVVHASEDGPALLEAAAANGFEGVIGKRTDSKYEAGKRSNAWLKVKPLRTGAFLVGGWSRGKGTRKLGALLVGERSGRKLRYASHVGTGFDAATCAALLARLAGSEQARCPFDAEPELNGPTTWVKPTLEVEVSFLERTAEGRLRAPVFVGVRESSRAPEPVPGPPSVGDEIASVLAQLESAKGALSLRVGPHAIALSNLDRVYWPEDKALGQRALTKRDLLRYLAQVSPFMLPHLADRPLTMIRMPSGIRGQRFFQKHWEQERPGFVEAITVFSGHKDESHEYLLCNNLPTLLWLGQAGTLEFHVWHSRAKPGDDTGVGATDYATSLASLEASILNYPDYVLFDIDPYIYSGKEAKGAEPELNTRAFEKGKEVAFRVRELLGTMGLEAIVKTSGKTGLHVFVPIRRTIDFEAARHVSETVGRHLVRLHPEEITVEWSVPKRTGKIFMDYNMNVRGKTLNVAYSPRGEPGAPVSMPLTWDELAGAHPLDFRIANAMARLAKTGDRWRDALARKQDLERAVAAAAKPAKPQKQRA